MTVADCLCKVSSSLPQHQQIQVGDQKCFEYNSEGKKCDLCLSENLHMMKDSLNQRSELSNCADIAGSTDCAKSHYCDWISMATREGQSKQSRSNRAVDITEQ